MATPGALQPQIRDIVAHGGVVPGGHHPASATRSSSGRAWSSVVVEIVVVTRGDVAGDAAGRRGANGRATSASTSADRASVEPAPAARADVTPGEWLEHSPLLTVARRRARRRLPRPLLRAARPSRSTRSTSTSSTSSFLLARLPAARHAGAADARRAGGDAGGLGRDPAVPVLRRHRRHHHRHAPERAARRRCSSASRRRRRFPPLVAIYSAVLGVFVPSGGSKWVIEAPYVMAAAHDAARCTSGWVVAAYDLGEALANLVQPFWMLPILGLFGPARARRDGLHLRRLPRAAAGRPPARDAARPDAAVPAVGGPPPQAWLLPDPGQVLAIRIG